MLLERVEQASGVEKKNVQKSEVLIHRSRVHGFTGSGRLVRGSFASFGGWATNKKKGVVDEPIQRVRRAISLSCYDDCQKP